MVYETSDLRKNLKIRLDGAPYVVVESQFLIDSSSSSPGRGRPSPGPS